MCPPPRRAREEERGRIRAGRSPNGSGRRASAARQGFVASKSPREGAAVDQDVLAGDEARVVAGEEGAERAEFVRIAESPDRDSRLRISPRDVYADVPLGRCARKTCFLTVGLKRSRLDRVDCHVV